MIIKISDSLLSEIGEFVDRIATSSTQVDGRDVVNVTHQFTKGRFIATVQFNKQNTIAGLYVSRAK